MTRPLEAYLHHALTHRPEEAVALGAARPLTLRDPSPEGLAAEAAEIDDLLDALASTGSLDDRLDTGHARRALALRRKTIADGRAQRNLEVALVPHAIAQYLAARGRDVAPIALRVPVFLDALAETLRGADGAWDPLALEGVIHHALPAAADALDAWGASAAAAAHRRLADVLEALPTGDDALGPEEVDARLALFGIDEDAAAIDAAADAALDALAREARPVADSLGVTLAPGVVGAFSSASLEDVGGALAASCARAIDTIRARGLFDLPADFEVRRVPAPSAMVHGNWPCAVLDDAADGALLVPATWPRFWADVYAVHEGAPGHYLQSRVWQRTERARPWRHLGVADDLAAATHDFAPMVAVEGWAVHAEELMRRHGFFTGEGALAVLVSHAIRAARARVDLGLARRTMTDDEAIRQYVERAWMPEPWARAQLVRHRRVPLQGVTYFAGRRAIESLESRHPDPRAFRAWLLARGPIAPAQLAAHLPV